VHDHGNRAFEEAPFERALFLPSRSAKATGRLSTFISLN
jgi:hypothetical protein